MASNVELLGTDMFRAEHHIISLELDEIERELEAVIQRRGGWRQAVPAFRRLLVLLEADVERHAEEEEHLIFSALARLPGGPTPTLTACYREHRDLRLEAEGLRRGLSHAFAGSPPPERELFVRSASLIGLLRVHMAREDEVLFTAAEQELSREDLLRMSRLCPISSHPKAA